jgi:hypothetical protein
MRVVSVVVTVVGVVSVVEQVVSLVVGRVVTSSSVVPAVGGVGDLYVGVV